MVSSFRIAKQPPKLPAGLRICTHRAAHWSLSYCCARHAGICSPRDSVACRDLWSPGAPGMLGNVVSGTSHRAPPPPRAPSSSMEPSCAQRRRGWRVPRAFADLEPSSTGADSRQPRRGEKKNVPYGTSRERPFPLALPSPSEAAARSHWRGGTPVCTAGFLLAVGRA